MKKQTPIQNITGWRYLLLEIKMLLETVRIANNAYPTRRQAWQSVRKQIAVHLEFKRICHLQKAVRVGGQVFIQMTFPRIGGEASKQLVLNELNRNIPMPGRTPGLNVLVLAMTKKCSLQCEHCFEWDNLNQREHLSVSDVTGIIQKFQTYGVASIELSGGEPLNRFDDLVQILRENDTDRSDFWLLSSGYRLSATKANTLKEAGLVGICISLDHWDAGAHDRFRGLEGSFDWAEKAAANARAAGLAVCLTLTAVREFCTEENLWQYARLARQWGVHFIRILEPRAVGHFKEQDVLLGASEIEVLETFVEKIQQDRAFRDFPMVDYYAAYQRRKGCSGAGKRFLYVDTDGEMHACPFCPNTCGNACKDAVETGIERMQRASGCYAYETVG